MRRYAAMKPSRGTVIPADVRLAVLNRDQGCVAQNSHFGSTRPAPIFGPWDCEGPLELDHVRAGGMGMKSPSTPDNLVSLCGAHHRYKTEHGREVRPILLDYLAGVA